MNLFDTILQPSLTSEQFLLKILGSMAVIILLWLLRLVVGNFITRQDTTIEVRYQSLKTSTYLFAVLGVIIIGRIWIAGVQSLITFLGLLSAGIAIALQQPLINLVGWLFILSRQPFKVGDRIEIGSHAGDVVDIRVFQFIILEIGNWVEADQSTGRIIHVPNGKIFSDALANYGEAFSYIWHEIPVLITFESDWGKAKSILQDIINTHAQNIEQKAAEQVKRAARRFPIKYSKLTPVLYTKVKDNGVLLTIRYLCEVRRRRTTEQNLWEDILKAFAQHADIDFAYPTQRFYYKEQVFPAKQNNSQNSSSEPQ
jgi:small-conductance mechanosensitive channel